MIDALFRQHLLDDIEITLHTEYVVQDVFDEGETSTRIWYQQADQPEVDYGYQVTRTQYFDLEVLSRDPDEVEELKQKVINRLHGYRGRWDDWVVRIFTAGQPSSYEPRNFGLYVRPIRVELIYTYRG